MNIFTEYDIEQIRDIGKDREKSIAFYNNTVDEVLKNCMMGVSLLEREYDYVEASGLKSAFLSLTFILDTLDIPTSDYERTRVLMNDYNIKLAKVVKENGDVYRELPTRQVLNIGWKGDRKRNSKRDLLGERFKFYASSATKEQLSSAILRISSDVIFGALDVTQRMADEVRAGKIDHNKSEIGLSIVKSSVEIMKQLKNYMDTEKGLEVVERFLQQADLYGHLEKCDFPIEDSTKMLDNVPLMELSQLTDLDAMLGDTK